MWECGDAFCLYTLTDSDSFGRRVKGVERRSVGTRGSRWSRDYTVIVEEGHQTPEL